MCIMCNVGFDLGDRFMDEFASARVHMNRAAAAMLECKAAAKSIAVSKQYDRTHKAMVKLIRDWNRLQEMREAVLTEDKK